MTAKRWVIVAFRSLLSFLIHSHIYPFSHSAVTTLQTFTLCINSHTFYVCAQSCLTLCDPMDCSSPGSSVHRISRARILELPLLSPRDLPDPEIELMSPVSPALQADSLSTEPSWKPRTLCTHSKKSTDITLAQISFSSIFLFFFQVPDHLAKMLDNLHNFMQDLWL